MKIVVKKTRIVDSTDYGEAIAIWDGDTPTENGEYHVELDLDDNQNNGKQ